MILAIVLGPCAWAIAFVVVAIVVERSDAIGTGLLVTACSLVVGFVVLLVLRSGRSRERRRYADRG